MVAPSEYMPITTEAIEGDKRVVFSVYNGNYAWVRFNLTVCNLKEELLFENHTWSYFNAEIYDLRGSHVGNVRPESKEGYLMFLAPEGRHVRSWMWDKHVYVDGNRVKLDGGRYMIVGVYNGQDHIIRMEPVEFGFTHDYWYNPEATSEELYRAINLERAAVASIRQSFFYASVFVIILGFLEDRLLVSLRDDYFWNLDWAFIRRMLWIATVTLSILMLGMMSASLWVYEIFR
ncbi:MAG TPA: hypothetical protein VMW22_02720 [Candidatus Desulfaltia sp.]|nr:hypothetical protein [Candidatus Desulfaltia sp.]